MKITARRTMMKNLQNLQRASSGKIAVMFDPDPVGSAFIWVCGSGSGRIRLYLGRGIRIQSHKMKEKSQVNYQNNFLFFSGNYIFKTIFERQVICKVQVQTRKLTFLTFKRWFEINFLILLTWMRIHITDYYIMHDIDSVVYLIKMR